MKKIFIILFIVILSYLSLDDSYDLKIEVPVENQNPINTDNNIAKNIEDKFLKIQEIKDLIIFSSFYGCNIYCKFKNFCSKNEAINKIERELNSIGIKNYIVDDKYNLKYQYFIVITSKNEDYYLLKDKADKIYSKLLNFKLIKDIKLIGTQQKVNYIHFSSSDLLNFSISQQDIKNKIKEHNNSQNFLLKNDNSSFFPMTINSKIESIEDIKNIPLEFKNSNFSTNFDNVFKIEKAIKYPKKYEILFNNQKAIVIAVAKKIYFPKFLLNYFLKGENIKIICPNNLKRYEKSYDNNSNIDFSEEKVKQIQKNLKKDSLFFIGITPPKTNSKEYFDEIFENRIIGYINRFDKTNFKNNKTKLLPNKISAIEYKINNFELSKLKLDKKEVLDSLLAKTKGDICGYYFSNKDKVEILLKTNDDEFYSKSFNTLIPQNSIVSSNYKSQYNIIARKNGKYVEITKLQNPFKFKGVQFQIRYLLSL